ncbi:PTS system mannose/fructose/sorbose family transporter subunit IID [Dielma fastidiosa]|uniref:PTS system mannose/fructose/sorbose family transporter subunit IID n=1 Tax=Dielma fastidiosa TaxID=1034346 RepID=UPI003567756A
MIFDKLFPKLSKEEHGTLIQMATRTRFTQATKNPAILQGHGFFYTINPYLQEIYKDQPDELQAAYERHNGFFNTSTVFVGMIAAITYSFEKEKGNGADIDPATIDNIKIAMMGPLAGIGDTFMQGVFKTICGSIAMGLAASGNILAPFVYIILNGLCVNVFLRYYFTFLGYTSGEKILENLGEGGLLESLTKASSVLGLMMIGALSAQLVKVSTSWVINISGTELIVQNTLDSILPGILPIALVFAVIALLKKKIAPVYIIFGMMILCVMLTFIGII